MANGQWPTKAAILFSEKLPILNSIELVSSITNDFEKVLNVFRKSYIPTPEKLVAYKNLFIPSMHMFKTYVSNTFKENKSCSLHDFMTGIQLLDINKQLLEPVSPAPKRVWRGGGGQSFLMQCANLSAFAFILTGFALTTGLCAVCTFYLSLAWTEEDCKRTQLEFLQRLSGHAPYRPLTQVERENPWLVIESLSQFTDRSTIAKTMIGLCSDVFGCELEWRGTDGRINVKTIRYLFNIDSFTQNNRVSHYSLGGSGGRIMKGNTNCKWTSTRQKVVVVVKSKDGVKNKHNVKRTLYAHTSIKDKYAIRKLGPDGKYVYKSYHLTKPKS